MPIHAIEWTPEQLISIGRFATAFGGLETALRGAVLQLAEVRPKVARILMPSTGVNDNRERVKLLLKMRLPDARHVDVNKLMAKLADLGRFRNSLLHTPPRPMGNVVWSSDEDEDIEGIAEDERHAMFSSKLGLLMPKLIDDQTREAHEARDLLLRLWREALSFPIPD